MTSAKSLATRIYLQSVGIRLLELRTWEYLLYQCSLWKYLHQELWQNVGKAMDWKAGQCRRAQVSELFCMEICDMELMDVEMFPPGWVASGKWWGVRSALWLVNGKMSLHVWVYVYQSSCWLNVSVTPSVLGPIQPSGPVESSPGQFSPGPERLGIGPIPVQQYLGLDLD